MDIDRLNEAFENFTTASKHLESYYSALLEKVRHLTTELERKNRRLEEALAEAERSREYLRAVLYNIEDAVVVLDSDNRITMINGSAQRMLGLDGRTALGRPFDAESLGLVRRGPETVLQTSEGPRYVLISDSAIRDDENRRRGRVVLIKDVTRIKELTTEHERNQRLIAMGEMASRLAHEIRNSLCSIELLSNVLEKELAGTPQERLVLGIGAGIGSLNNVLANMLSFVSTHRPRKQTHNLEALVDECLEKLAPLFDARDLGLTKRLEADIVWADAELTKQVLLNLLINAIQAVDGGGTICVRSRCEPAWTVIEVVDDGVGIADEALERIFDPFYTTKEGGTGLGLTISLNLIQQQGGQIRVSSQKGKGTAVAVYLPRPQAEV